jgi:hypothetical protein
VGMVIGDITITMDTIITMDTGIMDITTTTTVATGIKILFLFYYLKTQQQHYHTVWSCHIPYFYLMSAQSSLQTL